MNDVTDGSVSTRWLVGVDGSHDAAAALRWAVSVVEGGNGEVVPVCAWHVPLPIFALAGRRVADVDRMGLQATAEVAAGETIELVDAGDIVGGSPRGRGTSLRRPPRTHRSRPGNSTITSQNSLSACSTRFNSCSLADLIRGSQQHRCKW